MAITPAWYGLGLLAVVKQQHNLETAAVKLSLHTDVYVPNRDTHDFWNDATSELAAGNGYVAGGVTLAGVAWSYDAATDEVRLDFTDPVWAFTAAKTWRFGVIYVDTGGASTTDPLIALLTWDANQTVSTGYTLNVDPAGLIALDTT